MPKNKFQDVVFTIIMATIMVFGMVVYNVTLNTGGVSTDTFPVCSSRIANHGSDCVCLRVFCGW